MSNRECECNICNWDCNPCRRLSSDVYTWKHGLLRETCLFALQDTSAISGSGQQCLTFSSSRTYGVVGREDFISCHQEIFQPDMPVGATRASCLYLFRKCSHHINAPIQLGDDITCQLHPLSRPAAHIFRPSHTASKPFPIPADLSPALHQRPMHDRS